MSKKRDIPNEPTGYAEYRPRLPKKRKSEPVPPDPWPRGGWYSATGEELEAYLEAKKAQEKAESDEYQAWLDSIRIR